jgi:hypothetical protein
MKKVRIGGGQGFFGDINDAAIHMVKKGELQYLACDYLAELTLSILQRQRLRNPEKGFAQDFIVLLQDILQNCLDQKIKVLSNAGGMNVVRAVQEIVVTAKNLQIPKIKVGYVLGDDILARIPEMVADGISFANMDNGQEFSSLKGKIVNANVYYGHEPIVECLKMGADIVVTGRATDSALFLAPLIHEFGWQSDDWSKLAKGIIVGHLLECGGQGSGGNFDYDWRNVPAMDDLGYPIAEVGIDGEIEITKAPECGGLITEQVIKEQLLYEIHDPENYITPDVVVDISKAELKTVGKDRVAIKNINGRQRPEMLKLNIGYLAGYRTEGYLPYSWPDAYEKANFAAEILKKKLRRKGLAAEEILFDFVGFNSLHGPLSTPINGEENEVMLRIALRTKDREEALKLVPEIAPLQLNGPPGSCFFGGRPKISEIIGLWPTLIPRELVTLSPHIEEVK